ncbi:MAG: EamA family transporter [Rhodospirillales bacterium]
MADWLWIPITVAAALFQCLRTAMQKYLKSRRSTVASTYTRFVYGMPVAILYALALVFVAGYAAPRPSSAFLFWVAAGSAAQILATFLLLYVLGFRNFPVGVAYSKTEVVQAAVFGLAFLGDAVSAWGVASIAVGTFGVMLMSMVGDRHPLKALLAGWFERTALLGIASGAFFAIAANGFRAASLSLGHPSPLMAAAYTLAWATALQSLIMTGYIAWRERGQFREVIATWRLSGLAGLASVLGSGCWFTAMTLTAVAYVRTLGLVELVFTFLVSALWFRERPRPAEAAGVALIVAAVAMILNAP